MSTVVPRLQQRIKKLSVTSQRVRETPLSCSADACWRALSHHVVGMVDVLRMRMFSVGESRQCALHWMARVSCAESTTGITPNGPHCGCIQHGVETVAYVASALLEALFPIGAPHEKTPRRCNSARETCRVITPKNANPDPQHPRTRTSKCCGRSCGFRPRQLPRNPDRTQSVPSNCCLSDCEDPSRRQRRSDLPGTPNAEVPVIGLDPRVFTRIHTPSRCVVEADVNPAPCPRNNSCIRLKSLVATSLQAPLTSMRLFCSDVRSVELFTASDPSTKRHQMRALW